ncbi:BTAD domain-containing putative transcriptional regulator [Rhodobium gokarnense]|uniref:DNA-binding SARP family transcriptional activator/TolB-like protein n=1 Tax=Rhodobium gokarnense TaxID=364296 RepID=A0ABT3HAF2_9HYPH|nr:BTAD domain-containing putative transcriptional regulator [Rhodobium gokarnense]MCW2307372.1 DNA-binding SARP family transcriptional activator/TolB-like protein [Rhodobium gokarnense]
MRQTFRLYTFGNVRLTDRDGQTIPFPEKGLVTLVYLRSRGLTHISRAELARVLWGEQTDADILRNLRQLILRVKTRQHELGTTLFHIGDNAIGLEQGNLSFDLDDLDQARDAAPAVRLRALVTHVRGLFLADVNFQSEQVQFWIEGERAKHLSALAADVQALATRRDVKTFADLVQEAAFRLLELDAYNDVAYEALMRVFACQGQLAQAKAIFAQYKERLWHDLGTSPPQQTLDLTRALRIAEPVRRPRQDAGSFAAARAPTPDAVEPIRFPRVALLPPTGDAPDDTTGLLAAALLEDVTIGLCRVRTIKTVAPRTARQIAAREAKTGDLLHERRIGYAVETRFSARTGRASLWVELVDVPREDLLWAERFDLTPSKLPRSYNEMVRLTVGTVAGRIEADQLARIDDAQRPSAYQHYLLAQRHLRRVDLPDIRRARKAFRASLRDAPEFSGALAGLARTEQLEWLLTARGDAELLESAETHALQAILMDGDDAGGYRALGVTKLFQGAFDESIDAFKGAEISAPWYADLLADYADTLVHASEPGLALDKINLAIELNPYCPDIYWWTAAGANYFQGGYQAALSCINNMDDKNAAVRLEAACWGMLGDKAKANALMRRTMSIFPDFEIEKWLAIMPVKESWQKDQYREGLRKAGFK